MARTIRPSFLKDRLFLFLLLAVFILLKLPHLDYPFYWDECWPYASAVRRMYDAGPSLLPGVIPNDYSRGHPLLFHFLAALWMKVFGTSHVAMHAFPLMLSVVGLAGFYEAGLKLFNRSIAIVSTLLLAFQVMFFIQSSFLLPEVFLAFLGFFSIYFYARRRFGWTIVFLTALFYTKESGMVVGVLLGLDALLFLFRREEPLRQRVFNFLSVALPVLLIGLFFILQKQILGWYVFPFHTGLIVLDIKLMRTKLRGCFDVIFVHDLRQYILLLLLLLFAGVAFRGKNLKVAADRMAKKLWKSEDKVQARFIKLLLLFIPLFFLFTCINMFIGRYLLIALLPVLLIGAILLEEYARTLWPSRGLLALLLVIAGVEAVAFYKNDGHGDMDPGAYDAMYVQEQVVAHLEQQQYHHLAVSSNAYLERVHLTDPYTGYLKGTDTFSDVTSLITAGTQVVIFDNIEPDFQHEAIKADTSFQRVLRVDKGGVWAEIYVRNRVLLAMPEKK